MLGKGGPDAVVVCQIVLLEVLSLNKRKGRAA